MGRMKDFWILDKGKFKAYELREELKRAGAFWNPKHKSWKIENIERNSNEFKAIKKLGLELQACVRPGSNC